MSVLDTVFAKSARNGAAQETLVAHSTAAMEASFAVRDRIGRLPLRTDPVLDTCFGMIVALAALGHDQGKLADGFQRMLADPRSPWGERHEFLSLPFLAALIEQAALLPWVEIAVVTHHRALTADPVRASGRPTLDKDYEETLPPRVLRNLGQIDHEQAAELVRTLAAIGAEAGLPAHAGPLPADMVTAAHTALYRLLDVWREDVDPRLGLHAVLLQGAVTMADHLSSAHQPLDTHSPLGPDYLDTLVRKLRGNHSSLRPHQQRAAEVSGHVLIRAATGSGKTEAGLAWAARNLQEITAITGAAPRVFYTLPYLASINAMVIRLETDLDAEGRIGVAHSRAASFHLARSLGEDEQTDQQWGHAAKAVSRKAASALFKERLRVTTPYQLLRGILAGPVHSSILLDTANSVFVFDELHAYDPQRLGFILAGMRLWEQLGGRIAVMSATLPTALAQLISDTLTEPVASIDAAGWGSPPRHRLHLDTRHLTDPASIAQIAEKLRNRQSVLVVANNVAHAQLLFERLAPIARDAHPDDDPDAALLLHARFKRGHRNHIEQALKTRYGTDAPHRPGGLLVATQTVEISLDVDFDTLHTSGTVLEALLQRFGRVNRKAARPPADTIVHQPAFTTRAKAGPEYADGVYPREPVELALAILRLHDGELIDEDTAQTWLDEIYASDWGARWSAEVADWRTRVSTQLMDYRKPFHDRSHLHEQYDELFDGSEAILAIDRQKYAHRLRSGKTSGAGSAAGRLLAEDLLIPLPRWARGIWDTTLKVHVIDADYDQSTGLGATRKTTGRPVYEPGEVI